VVNTVIELSNLFTYEYGRSPSGSISENGSCSAVELSIPTLRGGGGGGYGDMVVPVGGWGLLVKGFFGGVLPVEK
jgi:hypothetical protein